MLQLERPLAFIDIETTGTDTAKDRIVEISIIKIFPDGRQEEKTHRVNPGISIPLGASKIHGIFDKDVADKPLFTAIAPELNDFIMETDLAGFNSNHFDIPLLVEEFYRAGIEFDFKGRRCVDVQNIFHKMEPRNLGAAYKFYCDKELVNAHGAKADVTATYEVLLGQLQRYPALKNNVGFLSEYSNFRNNADLAGRIVYDETGNEIFNFGKHKGKLVVNVFMQEPSYYSWMMNGDFPIHTKRVITGIWNKARNKKYTHAK